MLGASPDSTVSTRKVTESALSGAVESRNLKMIPLLILFGATVSAELIEKVIWGRNPDILRVFLFCKVDINAITATSYPSILETAIRRGSPQMVKLLLDFGVRPHANDPLSTIRRIDDYSSKVQISKCRDLVKNFPKDEEKLVKARLRLVNQNFQLAIQERDVRRNEIGPVQSKLRKKIETKRLEAERQKRIDQEREEKWRQEKLEREEKEYMEKMGKAWEDWKARGGHRPHGCDYGCCEAFVPPERD
jgi:hypothetical protein